jgi:hypothetical protein
MQPLGPDFHRVGAIRSKRKRRTYTSWFKEDAFTALAGFAGKLRASRIHSRNIFMTISNPRRARCWAARERISVGAGLVGGSESIAGTRVERKKGIAEKNQEKLQIEQDLAAKPDSSGLRRKQEQLEGNSSTHERNGPLYETNRFKHVKLSEY